MGRGEHDSSWVSNSSSGVTVWLVQHRETAGGTSELRGELALDLGLGGGGSLLSNGWAWPSWGDITGPQHLLTGAAGHPRHTQRAELRSRPGRGPRMQELSLKPVPSWAEHPQRNARLEHSPGPLSA